MKKIDCDKCGRHYEQTVDEPLEDIETSLRETGYCGEICQAEWNPLHTIHGFKTCDIKTVEECPDAEAVGFGLYRIKGAELEHLHDFASRADAISYAQSNGLNLKPYCEECLSEGGEGLQGLTQLACFGGAAGIAYACPTHYQDHLDKGGSDEEGNSQPCDICATDDRLAEIRVFCD